MSRSRPSIIRRETWASWEKFCLDCLLVALRELRELSELPENENAINAKLHECLRRAAKTVRVSGPYATIGCESPPQPYGESEETSRRLKACPDFVWGFVDHHEPDPLCNAREFAIECKRLRRRSRSWNYNESYVVDGIERFIDPAKRYGVGVSSSVMVGYWQDMKAEDILIDVNAVAARGGIPVVVLSVDGWQFAAISKLEHTLTRPFPVTPFSLRHLWIDLRGQCRTTAQV